MSSIHCFCNGRKYWKSLNTQHNTKWFNFTSSMRTVTQIVVVCMQTEFRLTRCETISCDPTHQSDKARCGYMSYVCNVYRWYTHKIVGRFIYGWKCDRNGDDAFCNGKTSKRTALIKTNKRQSKSTAHGIFLWLLLSVHTRFFGDFVCIFSVEFFFVCEHVNVSFWFTCFCLWY